MENLKDTLKELLGYREELGMKKLSDDMILDVATRIFISQNISNRQSNPSPYKARSAPPNYKSPSPQGEQEMATDGQKKFLTDLKYGGDIEVLTKREAHALLQEITKGRQR